MQYECEMRLGSEMRDRLSMSDFHLVRRFNSINSAITLPTVKSLNRYI